MTDKSKSETRRTVAEERIPLVEERVRIDRRVIAGRTVSVSTHPETETVRVEEPTTSERITVERVPVGRVVDSVPEVREEGDLTIIPVVDERVVVTTELVPARRGPHPPHPRDRHTDPGCRTRPNPCRY